jgi:hypothetical protein
MSTFETITAATALVAVVISLVALGRTRQATVDQANLQREQAELQRAHLELQREQAELASKLTQLQLEEAEQVRSSRARPEIRVALQHRLRGGEEIVISNVGGAAARNVRLEIFEEPNKSSPLVEGDVDDKLPIELLEPGESCPLMAALDMGSYPPYKGVVRWSDPSGAEQEQRFTLHDVV